MDRRTFIKTVGVGLAARSGMDVCELAHACDTDRTAKHTGGTVTRVAVMSDDRVRNKNGYVADKVADLLAKAIAAAFGSQNAESGLGSVVGQDDIVGIKLNCLAGQPLSPSRELVQALIDLFKRCKLPEKNLVFFERAERDLVKGGFEVSSSGDGPRFLGNNSVGCGYESQPEISGQVGSCLSKIVTRKITVLINLGVLKDHNLSGVSVGMKNLFGIIHNPNKYHDNQCDPYVADVSAFGVVKRKLRLTIIDGLTAQCEGGPGYLPEFAWPFNGVLASTDPVALDRVSLEIIESRRKIKGLPSLKEVRRSPKWLTTAAEKGLGVADLEKIKVVRGV